MRLGPIQRPQESVSAYRLRYAGFSFACSAVFALALLALILLSPSIRDSNFPLVLMFFYVGLPLALGASLLAGIGFLIGAAWAHIVDRAPGARKFQRRAIGAFALLFFTPFLLFSGYLFATGLLDGKVPAFKRGDLLMLTQADGIFYWGSVIAFGITTCLFLWLALRAMREIISPNRPIHPDRLQAGSRPPASGR